MSETSKTRREMLQAGIAFAAVPAVALLAGADESSQQTLSKRNNQRPEPTPQDGQNGTQEASLRVHYLEIVNKDVDGICSLYEKTYGVSFGEAQQVLGGARTAKLGNGGMLGVRAPMHDQEKQVVRPYMLVDNIEKAVAVAADAGAEIAVPPMEIAGHGTCAIVIHGELEAGLWQL